MSHQKYFTTDEALAAVLAESESDFTGNFNQAELPTETDEDDVHFDVVDDSDVTEQCHFLDRELDVAATARQFTMLSIGDQESDDDLSLSEDETNLCDDGGAAAAEPNGLCGCVNNCIANFRPSEVEQNRLSMAELEKPEFDLLLMGFLAACMFNQDTTARHKKRKFHAFAYSFLGKRVCLKAFRYIYGVGTKQLKHIIAHMKQNGLVPRVHGNARRQPKHALKYQDVEGVVRFIKTVTEKCGIPHPAPLHGRSAQPPVFLPSYLNFVSCHKDYLSACTESGICPVGLTSFRCIWQQLMGHVKFMTPRTDVCDLCERLRRAVVCAPGEGEKLEACEKFQSHVHAAQHEREVYKKATITAKEEVAKFGAVSPPCIPCSNELFNIHYTFDFAQNVQLPQCSRQVGPLYFKVPRKVQIFGVNNESLPLQVNYLLDEIDTIGQDGKKSHGPNTVASLLHHFFCVHGFGEKGCILSADNCGGQNKNRTIVAYLAWRCIVGLHESVTYDFMLAGHTRCLVDGCFGLLKQKYRRSNVYSMEQLAQVVDQSSTVNSAVLFSKCSAQWYAWDTFLARHFKPVPGISRLHHIKFSAADPGIIKVKDLHNTEERSINIVKTTVAAIRSAGMPEVLTPAGLSQDRQAYLFKQIRPHVPPEFQDELCPPPAASQDDDFPQMEEDD